MLGIVLSWVRSNWQSIIVGILVLALAFYIGYLKVAIGNAQGDVARLKGEVAGWKSNYAILEAKAAQQQAAVAQLEAESARKQKAGIIALAAAKKRAVGLQAQADWLAAQLAKPPKGETCAGAFKAWRTQP